MPDAGTTERAAGVESHAFRHAVDHRFWKAIVAVLVAGYQAGFLWVAAVGIYLLLRRDIDGVQTGEVFVDQAEEYGMPPLTDDAATGVPEIAPREPALPGDTGPAAVVRSRGYPFRIASSCEKNWPRLTTRSQPASRAAASRCS